MLMNSRGGSPFWGCILMNSGGGPLILREGPPLGTIFMDLAVEVFNITLRLNYNKLYFHFHKRLVDDLSLTPNLFVIYYEGQT